MKFLFILALFSFSSISNAYYKIDSGIYSAHYFNKEVCDQKVRSLYDDEGTLAGIYVTYTGQCLGQGPYYYFCNDEKENECYNINHRFKILKDNLFLWENEVVKIYGVYSRK